jgi:hypothetical protein
MMQTENCRSESKVVLEMSALLLVAIAFFLDRGPPLPSLHWRLLPGVVREGSSNSRRPGCSHAPVATGPLPSPHWLRVGTEF